MNNNKTTESKITETVVAKPSSFWRLIASNYLVNYEGNRTNDPTNTSAAGQNALPEKGSGRRWFPVEKMFEIRKKFEKI